MPHKPFPGTADLVHHQTCPFCDSHRLTSLGTPVEHESTPLNYHQCNRCRLIFMNPRPNQSWYNDLYQNEFWEVKKEKKTRGAAKFQVIKEGLWAEKLIHFLDRMDFVTRNPAPKILEIGCAFGVIGKLVAEHYGGESHGVEPSDSARQFAQDITGVNMFCETMDDVIDSQEDSVFDLVIFSHVLENITRPDEALAAVHRLLKPNGILLIDTPNNFCRRSWHIHHPYCFTLPALKALLSKSGFELEHHKTWSRPKFLASPVYLTVGAVKSDSISCFFKEEPLLNQVHRMVGYCAFNFLCRGPLKRINTGGARRMWRLNANHRIRTKEIFKSAKAMGRDV